MYSLGKHINPVPINPFSGRGRKSGSITIISSISSNSSKPLTHAQTPTTRRSGNYKPPCWDYGYIQSLTSQYREERHSTRAGQLIEQVKMLLLQLQQQHQMELIDDLYKLGISYHFDREINQILDRVYSHHDPTYFAEEKDLYSTASCIQAPQRSWFPSFSRWDVKAIDQLPHYMQMCFLTLNNFVNEMAYDVLKDQGILIIQHLRKSWIDLFRTYTQEAMWYTTQYTPTLDEYMSNAWISISAPVILTHAYFLITTPIHHKAVRSLYRYHDIVRYSAMLLRLANDLGTSPYEMERGDVPKSVECYMKETGASREEAGEHVKYMIWETWKKLNEERFKDSEFSKEFIRSAIDLGRMAQYMYHLGDGHGIQNPQIKNQISSLLFEPIV